MTLTFSARIARVILLVAAISTVAIGRVTAQCNLIANVVPQDLTVVNGKMMFHAMDQKTSGSRGEELYTSDGTPAGTAILKDILPGAGSAFSVVAGYPQGILLNGKYLFFADDGVNGKELWESDATAAGTQLLVDLRKGAASYYCYFAAANADRTVALFTVKAENVLTAVWRTDGTAAGTYPLTDMIFNSGYIGGFRSFGNTFFFVNYNTNSQVTEQWFSDGTAANTRIFAGPLVLSAPIVFNGANHFFTIKDKKTQLWKTDGTEANTVKVLDLYDMDVNILNSPQTWAVMGGNIYFEGNPATTYSDLMKTDGLTSTIIKRQLNSRITDMTVIKDHLYFLAKEASSPGLMVSDGTPANTYTIKTDFAMSPLYRYEDTLLFMCLNYTLGRSDGTAAGTTTACTEIQNDQSLLNEVIYNGALYFGSMRGLHRFGNSTAGIDVDQSGEKWSRIYPNPGSQLIVTSSKEESIRKIEVYDASGLLRKTYLSSTPGNESERFVLDLQDLSAGTYIVQISSVQGSRTERVVRP